MQVTYACTNDCLCLCCLDLASFLGAVATKLCRIKRMQKIHIYNIYVVIKRYKIYWHQS